MPGHAPSFVSTSLWQTPQACTLMRTCPTPVSGIARSTISKSAPGLGTCAAFICTIFIGTTVTLLVAINPPISEVLIWSDQSDVTFDRLDHIVHLSAPDLFGHAKGKAFGGVERNMRW